MKTILGYLSTDKFEMFSTVSRNSLGLGPGVQVGSLGIDARRSARSGPQSPGRRKLLLYLPEIFRRLLIQSIVSCARRIYRPQYTLAAARSLFHHAAGEYPEQHRISIHDGLSTFLVACEKARFLVACLCLREHRRLHRRRAFAAVAHSNAAHCFLNERCGRLADIDGIPIFRLPWSSERVS
jgi:hypothetical protein